jgi:hypothetical protein
MCPNVLRLLKIEEYLLGRNEMKIGFSTSVIQRGKTGVAQYVFALLRAFLPTRSSMSFICSSWRRTGRCLISRRTR